MSTLPPDPPDEITEALRVPLAPPSASAPVGPMVRADINITLGNVAIKTKVPVPTGPTSLRQLLPVLRAFTQALVHAATENAFTAGQPVSCKNRCAACCRKLVPIAPTETHMLAALVAAMPEPRRSEIHSRFDAANQKLAATHLLEPLADFSALSPERVNSLSTDYFHQQIACPFLDDESCSIYSDRPLVCREYLVTSEPARCADPTANITSVKLPGYMSHALGRTSDTLNAPSPKESLARMRIPLTLALDWAAAHPEAAPTLTGPQLLSQILTHLSGTLPNAANPVPTKH